MKDESINLIFKELVDRTTDPIAFFDQNNHVTYSNHSYQSLFKNELAQKSSLAASPAPFEEVIQAIRNGIIPQKQQYVDQLTKQHYGIEGFLFATYVILHLQPITQYIHELNYQLKQYKSMLDSIDVACLLLDKNLKLLAFNQKAIQNTRRLAKKELQIGEYILNYASQGTENDFVASFKKALKGEIVTSKRELVYSEYLKEWFNSQFLPAYNGDGEIFGVIFASTSIDHEINLDEKIIESERLYNEASEASLDAQFILKPIFSNNEISDFTIVKCNHQGAVLVNKERIDIIGKNYFSIFPYSKDDGYLEMLSNVFKTGKSFEDEKLLARQGLPETWINQRITSLGAGIVISARDITRSKTLQKAYERLSIVARETTNCIIFTDKDGMINFVNEGFSKITGYTADEVLGKKPGDILQGDETNQDTIKEMGDAIRAGKGFDVEVLNYTKYGKKYWIHITCTPIYENDELTGFFSIQTDVTTKNEDKNLLLERNKRLAEIAWYQSHKIRGPLASIIGAVNMIRNEKISLEQGEYVRLIDLLSKSTDQLDETIHHVVALTYKEIGDNNPSNISQDYES